MRLNHYRSGYESMIGQDLDERGIEYGFEASTIEYHSRVRGGSCASCGSKHVVKARKYKVDFTIPRVDGTVLYIEAKGRFPSTDRSKMRDVRKSNPTLDIRLLFQKRSKAQTVAVQTWCDKFGFTCAFGHHIPQEWLA